MTNIFGKPEKRLNRSGLFTAAVEALQGQGYKVERVPRSGKSSVRRITKQGISKTVSIRTTQDTWIAFPRNENNDGWSTLEDVDFVVAASVDNRDDPHTAKIHMIPAAEMRARFDRAYQARLKADYAIAVGRGIWVSLYFPEANDPVTHVGAGAGLKYPPIAEVPLVQGSVSQPGANNAENADQDPRAGEAATCAKAAEHPLTIPEAKRRLALSLGVSVEDIRITING